MDEMFQVRRVPGGVDDPVRAYWLESTAPLNVDDPGRLPETGDGLPEHVVPEVLTAEKAVDEIAAHLNAHGEPELVITIHGYNNPRDVAIRRYTQAYDFVLNDDTLRSRDGLVCVGYRWPSEKLGTPWGSRWSAAPGFLYGIAAVALVLLAFFGGALASLARGANPGNVTGLIVALTLFTLVATVPIGVVLLRAMTYFRDNYRAAQFAVPDLVEFLRYLDQALAAPGSKRRRRRVKLSFIGHSMGAFVVTGVVRILSDVFRATKSPQPGSLADDAPELQNERVSGDIGEALCLGRLVLVAPDIPAEALLTRRANFLQPSLRRFEEAYLFSNEGDEVLRLMSTLANYFSFPTRSRAHGYRLGNTEIVDLAEPDRGVPPAGLVNWDTLARGGESTTSFLSRLRVGSLTLDRLDASLGESRSAAHKEPAKLAERFTYFDCTDYREGARAYLTHGKRRPKLAWWSHAALLAAYFGVLCRRVDVHSGYFDGPFTQRLIYRLACLGFAGTLESLAPASDLGTQLSTLDRKCRDRDIQVLLSPTLFEEMERGTAGPSLLVEMTAVPTYGLPAGGPRGIPFEWELTGVDEVDLVVVRTGTAAGPRDADGVTPDWDSSE